MKLSRFKLLLIAPSLVVTACGYGLKEVYDGIPYNSSVFTENYFNVWDSRINPYSSNKKITVTKETHELDLVQDKVFTAISDANFRDCDPNWASYAYTYDVSEPEEEGIKAYGPAVAMINLDDSFRYGVVSKMFDGQMFCNGDFQKSRTQVEPTNQGQDKGFGVLFSKESNDSTYFMMNLKCSVVYEDFQNLPTCYSDLKITVGFYLRNDTGYTYEPMTYKIPRVPTNSGDDHFMPPYASRNNMYVCFGFSTENIETNRLIGFSIQYEYEGIYVSRDESNTAEVSFTEDILHAIMLYEVSFPHTTWH